MFTQLNSLTFVKVRELPRTKFKLRLRLAFIQLLSANGDGEIRTLDPLLARQVLSQLSYTPIGCGSSLFFQRQSLLNYDVCLIQTSGLKWTRTTDLTLIRRAL